MYLLNHYQRTRLLLIVGAVASLVIFWFVSGTFHVPFFHGYEGSLLREPHAAQSIFVVLITIIVCTLLGTLLGGWVRFDAGLFIAAIGLAMISMRGGTMGQVLRSAAENAPAASSAAQAKSPPGVMLVLAGELVLLYVFLLIAWGVQWGLRWRGLLKADSQRDGFVPQESSAADRITALVVQVIAMGALMILFCRSDAKAQTLASVVIASYIATLIAHGVFTVRPSIWFWSGPIIVGVVGYVLTYFNGGAWRLGEINWLLGPLARPVPLDYASFGVAASILAYWTSRRWQRDQETRNSPETTKTAAA